MSKRPKKENNVAVTLGLFDARYDDDDLRIKFSNVPLKEVKPLELSDYNPAGMTPLNDAVLNFIGVLDRTQKKNPDAIHIGLLGDESGSMDPLRKDVVDGFNTFVNEVREGQNGKKGESGVLMVIMTDGYENSSREDRLGDKMRNAIQSKEKEGWNFFYLGANQDAWATGNNMGFGANTHSVSYDNTSSGVKGSFAVASAAATTRSTSSSPSVYLAAMDVMADRNEQEEEDDE